jgi:hypothetical protein
VVLLLLYLCAGRGRVAVAVAVVCLLDRLSLRYNILAAVSSME